MTGNRLHGLATLGASLLLALEELAFALALARPRRARPAPCPAPPPALPTLVTWHLPRDPFGLPN